MPWGVYPIRRVVEPNFQAKPGAACLQHQRDDFAVAVLHIRADASQRPRTIRLRLVLGSNFCQMRGITQRLRLG